MLYLEALHFTQSAYLFPSYDLDALQQDFCNICLDARVNAELVFKLCFAIYASCVAFKIERNFTYRNVGYTDRQLSGSAWLYGYICLEL